MNVFKQLTDMHDNDRSGTDRTVDIHTDNILQVQDHCIITALNTAALLHSKVDSVGWGFL
jgi:hypothetical protein